METLPIADTHSSSATTSGFVFTIPINGRSGGFSEEATVKPLVGDTDIYLPILMKEN
jgi:hypothetical protein